MRRPTSLRAPFVVTLAATALGCGASVTPSPSPPDGSVGADVPVDRETPVDRPVVIETDVRRACPATLPTVGVGCTPGVDPETCTDPSMAAPGCPPGVGVTVRCDPSTQRWQALPSICNPPAPVQCPPTAPEDGSACPGGTYLSPPLRCGYDLCGTRPATDASCDGPTSRWRVVRSSCNPPAPVCPAAAPTPGAACALTPGVSCEWGSCAGRSTSRGTCVDGRWSIDLAECDVDAGAAPTDS